MERTIQMKNNGQINVVLSKRNIVDVENVPIVTEVKKEKDNIVRLKHSLLHELNQEFSKLIGMEEIRNVMEEIYAWIYINKVREEKGLHSSKQALHMLFKGNPGTGKTTVARMLGKFFHKMQILSKGHIIEAERADLVGEYIGHTAQKTRDLIKKAMGGILFIDEAYSLARGGEKDFGKEAIDTLVKHMEDKQHDFILILAGYSKEMNHFLSLNPGLYSRFPFIIDFPDYDETELFEMATNMYAEREYMLTQEASSQLKEHLLDSKRNYGKNFSNGRYIRNLVEKTLRIHANRLLSLEDFDKTDLMMIHSSDLVIASKKVKNDKADGNKR